MKRVIFLILLPLFMVVNPINATENSWLKVKRHSLTEKTFYPVSFVTITFDDSIVVQGNAVATVLCEDEVVAIGKLSVSNYDNDGLLMITFDPEIGKGRKYRFHLPSGAVASKGDSSVVNQEINFDFEIPEYLYAWKYSIVNGSTIVSSQSMTFYVATEIRSAGTDWVSTTSILFRENIPVRVVPSNVVWEWSASEVRALFGKEIKFEKGVSYSLILPEGSICLRHREDIVNREERIDFVGGYDQPFPELKYEWCSLSETDAVETLGEVQWGYTQQVALSLAPKIELRNEANELLKEVIPTLAEVEGEWIMTADFEEYAIDPNQVYHLVIPESTVVSPDGDVVVNKATSLRIANGVVGITGVPRNTLAITCANNQLRIEGTTSGDHIALYTIAGKTIVSQLAREANMAMELPHQGIFIVMVNGRAYKVVNR